MGVKSDKLGSKPS